MTAKEELRELIERSDYVDTTTNGLAKILRNAIEKGERTYNGSKRFQVYLYDASTYDGLLARLGLIGPIGFGNDSIVYPLTEKGIELGKKLLEESSQTVSSER
jgi:hypothetical protein